MKEKPLPETTRSIVQDLLGTAFEGGSNYWYMIERIVLPPGTIREDFSEGGKMDDPDNYRHYSTLIPTLPGGALIISSEELDNKKRRLDLKAIRRGMKLFREQFPKMYFPAFHGDDPGDASVGDVFLQLSLFGEVIFG